jgi:tRNA-modifying protein YgfZ
VVTEFINDRSRGCALLEGGIAAVDFSASGMLVLRGAESTDFLQRITTNDMSTCEPGSALQTVLVTDKAKLVDVVMVAHLGGELLMLCGAGRAAEVKARLERYIIMEDITIDDITGSLASSVILGTPEKLSAAFPPSTTPAPSHPSDALTIQCSYFSRPAVLLIRNDRETMDRDLHDRSIPLVSDEAFEAFRVRHGIPGTGKEITDRTNPLEAGLKPLISFTKGCYIGQEVIARLETYKKVQRFLCRVRLSPCPPDKSLTEIIGENGILGYITTIIDEPDRDGACSALAILRSPTVGTQLTLNDGVTTVLVEKIFE